jgi:hypothetical protein
MGMFNVAMINPVITKKNGPYQTEEGIMMKIRCVVERITYQNPENGYSVLKCRVKDYSELVPA